jgi:Zn-dependent oligopeptidase
VFEALR